MISFFSLLMWICDIFDYVYREFFVQIVWLMINIYTISFLRFRRYVRIKNLSLRIDLLDENLM